MRSLHPLFLRLHLVEMSIAPKRQVLVVYREIPVGYLGQMPVSTPIATPARPLVIVREEGSHEKPDPAV